MDAGEEEPRDDEPDPDDEAEQRHQVDGSQLAEALLPELTEVRHHSDREEGQDEEDHPQHIGFANRRDEFSRRAGGGSQRKRESDEERQDEAEDELGESLPDLAELRLLRAGLG